MAPDGRAVRVRGLHRHDQPVEQIGRGSRAADQSGRRPPCGDRPRPRAGRTRLSRGDPGPDGRLAASSDAGRPLKHRERYKLHVGTAEVSAVLSLLERARPPAGLAARPALAGRAGRAVHGQPFVLRMRAPRHDRRRPRDRSVVASASGAPIRPRSLASNASARTSRPSGLRAALASSGWAMDRATALRTPGLRRRRSRSGPGLAGRFGRSGRASAGTAADRPRAR